MNLMLETEKQGINYLNYNNALWDCFGFHIAQVSNILLNQQHCPIGQSAWTVYNSCLVTQNECVQIFIIYKWTSSQKLGPSVSFYPTFDNIYENNWHFVEGCIWLWTCLLVFSKWIRVSPYGYFLRMDLPWENQFNSIQFIYFPSLKTAKHIKKYAYVHSKMEEVQLKA